MNAGDRGDFLKEAKRVLQAEARAVSELADRVGESFIRAVEVLAVFDRHSAHREE